MSADEQRRRQIDAQLKLEADPELREALEALDELCNAIATASAKSRKALDAYRRARAVARKIRGQS